MSKMEVAVEENIASTSEIKTPKLGLCEVCQTKDAKYTCPRCEVKTCSLGCNKIHKLEVECNGERDRAKFIPIKKFSNFDLSSDYRLLEEISRVVEVSRKEGAFKNFKLERKLIRLQKEAMSRHVTLKFLPNTFVRHKNNSTIFNLQAKTIDWHIDWIFVNSDNLKMSDSGISENTRVSNALNKFLIKQDNADMQEKLQFYQAADLPGIKVLLKAEQKAGKKFFEMDPTMTIGECLRNKLIIEYPTVHLVLKDQATFYDIIDSDDEDDTQAEIKQHIKTGHEVINKIIKKSESDESLYESLKNLLFINEYSDEDENEF